MNPEQSALNIALFRALLPQFRALCAAPEADHDQVNILYEQFSRVAEFLESQGAELLNELDEAELADYAIYIAFYKRMRPIIQTGALYRLERLAEYQASVIEYVLPNGQEAVYSEAVRDKRSGHVRPPASLKGLISGAQYVALDRHQHVVHRATGYELMTLGLPRDTLEHTGSSLTLHLKDARLL